MIGDVFRAPYPFTNMEEEKVRPVIVVADVREGREMDWMVCEVTSRSRNRPMAIRIFPADMQEGSFKRPSWVRPNRISTLNEGVLADRIGRLTDAKIAEILVAVRALL